MTNAKTSTTGEQPKAARILLVEDNPGDAYLLEKALQHHQIIDELRRHPDERKRLKP